MARIRPEFAYALIPQIAALLGFVDPRQAALITTLLLLAYALADRSPAPLHRLAAVPSSVVMEGSQPESVLHWNLTDLEWRRSERSPDALTLRVQGLITELAALLLPGELETALRGIAQDPDVSIAIDAKAALIGTGGGGTGVEQWGHIEVWSDRLLDAFHPKQLKDTINEVFERVAREADERENQMTARAVEFRRVLVDG